MTSLTIGQVGKQTGISIDSIRFYERKKSISSPPRRLSGVMAAINLFLL